MILAVLAPAFLFGGESVVQLGWTQDQGITLLRLRNSRSSNVGNGLGVSRFHGKKCLLQHVPPPQAETELDTLQATAALVFVLRYSMGAEEVWCGIEFQACLWAGKFAWRGQILELKSLTSHLTWIKRKNFVISPGKFVIVSMLNLVMIRTICLNSELHLVDHLGFALCIVRSWLLILCP